MGINVSQVVTELGNYHRKHNQEINQIPHQGSEIDGLVKVITKVQGRWPSFHSITDRVVQGFKPEWQEMGTTKFKVKELKSYHHKVNFGLVPADILNSYVAFMYNEKKKLQDMPLAKFVFDKELPPKVANDRNYLYGNAEYDAANASGQFGKSMNGMKKLLADGVANGKMFQIPLQVFSDSNMVAQFEAFEDGIPDMLMKSGMKIYCSKKNAKRYRQDYRNRYGANTDYSKDQTLKTYSEDMVIHGLNFLNGTDYIFATVDGNWCRLIEQIDEAVVTDIQVADYKVKIFMEWWDGLDFAIDQLVFVGVPGGNQLGLGSAADNALYYPDYDFGGSGSGA